MRTCNPLDDVHISHIIIFFNGRKHGEKNMFFLEKFTLFDLTGQEEKVELTRLFFSKKKIYKVNIHVSR